MITKEQWEKISDLVCDIQRVSDEVDTSSIVMWLSMNIPNDDEKTKDD